MKRRFYALMLVVAMVAMTLVGCGSDTTDTTNTTNDVTVNTEIEESGEVVEPEVEVDVPETEVPEVETTEEPTTEEDDFYADSYQWAFPEGMDGFTDKYVLASDETMSFNCTHYVDINGNEMNFSWVGPTELGEKAGANKKTLNLYASNDNYILQAWNSGYAEEDYEQCINLPKETWISFADKNIPYEENGYYNVEITDNTIKIVFKVYGNGYEGYNYYVLDGDNQVGYQFAYLENNEIYDDERALSVVNSLEYWTYNPGEIVTE